MSTTSFRETEPASLENLLERLNNNEFDLVAVGRALIANPDWALKVRAGASEELKPYLKENLKSLV